METNSFATKQLPQIPDEVAPDGSEVRVLLRLQAGSMAHFELPAGRVARAVTHQTVEEVWFITAGRGEMWRKLRDREEVVQLEPGLCLTIPVGTHFQFRVDSAQAVAAIGVAMPPWPGDEEAVLVDGPWQAD